MKIVQIVPNLNSGGAEKFVVDLSNGLSKLGQDVLIITLGNPVNSFFSDQLDSSIKIIGLNKGPGFSFKCMFKLFKVIYSIKPTIINTHINALNYLLPFLFLLKAKKYHTIHNNAFKESSGPRRKVLKFLYRLNWLHPITISKDSHQSYIQAYGNNNATLVFNGVYKPKVSDQIKSIESEINFLKKDEKTKVAINIARITKQKNHLRLLEVFKKLQEKNVILLIIGDKRNDELDLFHRFQAEIPENVYYLGPKQNIGDYLSHSDAFILSSDYEGLPISLLEAISLGVIPICTPVGGVKEVIVENNIGFLSKTKSSEDLRASIVEFLESENDKIKIKRENCHKTYNSIYSMDQTSKNYIVAYEE